MFSSVEFREKQMKVDAAVDDIRRRFGTDYTDGYAVFEEIIYFIALSRSLCLRFAISRAQRWKQ